MNSNLVHNKRTIEDIEHLLEAASYDILRPCNSCDRDCKCSSSKTCTCMCQVKCEFAPQAMSSAPDAHPIEHKIVPLVFCINCLRVLQPYWSCEGHNSQNGKLFRAPQVWFYSESIIYPKMVGEYIDKLYHKKKIKNHWHICLAHTGGLLDTGYSIEPNIRVISQLQLKTMQEDIDIISDNMFYGLKDLAKEYLDRYKLN